MRKIELGYIFGLASMGVLFLSILYVISLNPVYDFRIHMISGLGIINGKEWFNIGVIIAGFFLFPFFESVRLYFKGLENNKYIVNFAYLFGVIFCFSLIGIGIFPATLKFGFQHGKVAFLFFYSSLFTTFLFSILFIGKVETKKLGYCGLIAFFFIFVFLYMREAFWEWIMLISVYVWISYISIEMLIKRITGDYHSSKN